MCCRRAPACDAVGRSSRSTPPRSGRATCPLLAEGDRLSADARIITGALEVDMSPLNGESEPVTRSADRSRPAAAPLEAEDLVFVETLCTGGDARAVVYWTGMHTQLGRIAALSQTVVGETSPLQRRSTARRN